MSRPNDVLDLLADARPARLDLPAGHARPDLAVRAILDTPGTAAPGYSGRRPAQRMRATAVGLAVAAGVTAVAFALAGQVGIPGSTPPGAVPPPPANADAPVRLDASKLLLAAAERSDDSATKGRYLVIQTETGNAWPITGADGTYTMLGRTGSELWLARARADRTWVFSQWLGAVPATSADEGAWRRDGAPTVVKGTWPKPAQLSTAARERLGNTIDPAHLFALGDRAVTPAQLDALPTDPDKLRAELLRRFTGGGGDMPTDRNEWLFNVGSHLVLELPVSGEVRGAAYRMLAELPGVRALGAVRDVRNRPGEAVAVERDHGLLGRVEERLIIAPDTGQALGKEIRIVKPSRGASWLAPGALATYHLAVGVEGTDRNPPKVG